jgi:hypothetical protein
MIMYNIGGANLFPVLPVVTSYDLINERAGPLLRQTYMSIFQMRVMDNSTSVLWVALNWGINLDAECRRCKVASGWNIYEYIDHSYSMITLCKNSLPICWRVFLQNYHQVQKRCTRKNVIAVDCCWGDTGLSWVITSSLFNLVCYLVWWGCNLR